MEKPETKGEKQDKAKMSTGMKTKWSSYYYDNGPEYMAGFHPELRKGIVDNVMEALVGDPNTHLIGVHGSKGEIEDKLLRVVQNRVSRDNLFDVVLRVSVTKKPDIKQIQDEIAGQMGFTFNEKSKSKRVNELLGKMKNIHRLLVILCDLHKGLDLGKVGIPFGEDHRGCKILLTSTSEEVLSKQMHTHKNFSV